jgi:DNA-binding NarL/FixJ family response regulator
MMASRRPARAQRRARRLKILVVDTSSAWRKRLSDFTAGQPGVNSIRSTSLPREGMERLLKDKPHVILLGVASDELFELDLLLCAKRKTAPAFVVVTVDRYKPRLQLKYLAAGADLFLIRDEVMSRLPAILTGLRGLRSRRLPARPRQALHPRRAISSRRRS